MNAELVTSLEDIKILADAIVSVESIKDTSDNINDAAISSFLSEARSLLEKKLKAFKAN